MWAIGANRPKCPKIKIREAFDVAVVSASKSGIKSVGAIANEKAAAAMRLLGDGYWFAYYIRRSHRLYVEWGAKAKADQLLLKFGNDIEGSSKFGVAKPQTEGHILGRSRFDETLVESLSNIPLEVDIGREGLDGEDD